MILKVFPGQPQWDFRIALKEDIDISLCVASKPFLLVLNSYMLVTVGSLSLQFVKAGKNHRPHANDKEGLPGIRDPVSSYPQDNSRKAYACLPPSAQDLILQSKNIWVRPFSEWSNPITLQHPTITKKLRAHSRTAWLESPGSVCVLERLSSNSLPPQSFVILEEGLCAWRCCNEGAALSLLDKRNKDEIICLPFYSY